jgi:hypothetical protein
LVGISFLNRISGKAQAFDRMRTDHFHVAAFRNHDVSGPVKSSLPPNTAAVSRSMMAINRAKSHAPHTCAPKRSKRSR